METVSFVYQFCRILSEDISLLSTHVLGNLTKTEVDKIKGFRKSMYAFLGKFVSELPLDSITPFESNYKLKIITTLSNYRSVVVETISRIQKYLEELVNKVNSSKKNINKNSDELGELIDTALLLKSTIRDKKKTLGDYATMNEIDIISTKKLSPEEIKSDAQHAASIFAIPLSKIPEHPGNFIVNLAPTYTDTGPKYENTGLKYENTGPITNVNVEGSGTGQDKNVLLTYNVKLTLVGLLVVTVGVITIYYRADIGSFLGGVMAWLGTIGRGLQTGANTVNLIGSFTSSVFNSVYSIGAFVGTGIAVILSRSPGTLGMDLSSTDLEIPSVTENPPVPEIPSMTQTLNATPIPQINQTLPGVPDIMNRTGGIGVLSSLGTWVSRIFR